MNILMFHRVELNNQTDNISKLYVKRGMVHNINSLYSIIEKYLKEYQIGSLEDALKDDRYFHITFDDGFKEHLEVATILKKKYNFKSCDVTFSINIGNSILSHYTGMDIIYKIIDEGKLDILLDFIGVNCLDLNEQDCIKLIKKEILGFSPEKLMKINKLFNLDMKNVFLDLEEVKKLSSIFTISSHGITHRNLLCHNKISSVEIVKSKIILEDLLNKQIDIFCYPEGKNNTILQNICKKSKFRFALSIRDEKDNKYCIGRKTIRLDEEL